MINTPVVRKLLEEDKLDKLSGAIEAGANDGMMSFNQCLLKLVNDSVITEETALDNATNPEQLQMNLKGIFLTTGSAILG